MTNVTFWAKWATPEALDSPPVETFRTFTELEALVAGDLNTPGDHVYDLGGDHYRPVANEFVTYENGITLADSTGTSLKKFTFRNGTISGAADLTFTSVPGEAGLFSADLPDLTGTTFTTFSTPRVLLIDDDAADTPYLQARRPRSAEYAEYQKYHALSQDDDWYASRRSDEGSITEDIVRTQAGATAPDANKTISVQALDSNVKAQWDAYFASNVGETVTMYRHTPNLISVVSNLSYDSATGTLTFAEPMCNGNTSNTIGGGSQSYDYMQFVFSGLDPTVYLEAGEYCLREGKIYYKPVSGQLPTRAYLPAIRSLLKFSGNGNSLNECHLENLTFRGTQEGSDSNTAAFVGGTSGESDSGKIIMDNVEAYACSTVTLKSNVNVTNSRIYDNLRRGLSSCTGGSVIGNFFGNSFMQSQLSSLNLDPADPMVIKDNFFHLPGTAHGQCISLYHDSFQRATVEHNIFYNSSRFMSFQGESGPPEPNKHTGDPAGMGTFKIENNLIFNDGSRFEAAEQGQPGVALQGDAKYWQDLNDNTLADFPQKLHIRYNSSLMDSSLVADSATTQFVYHNRVTVANATKFQTVLEGNIAPSIDIPAAVDYQASQTLDDQGAVLYDYPASELAVAGTYSSNNGYYENRTQIDMGFAATDKPVTPLPSQAGEIAYGSNLDTSVSLEPAVAGEWVGRGIQWTSVPTASQVAALAAAKSKDWAATYPASTLPAPPTFPSTVDDDIVVAGDDKRSLGTPVQTITFTYHASDGSATSIVEDGSTTQSVISQRTGGVLLNGNPRLWNGSEAANAGAVAQGSGNGQWWDFPDNPAPLDGRNDCAAWWQNWAIEAEVSGNSPVSLGNPVSGAAADSSYLNATGTGSALDGLVVTYYVYAI